MRAHWTYTRHHLIITRNQRSHSNLHKLIDGETIDWQVINVKIAVSNRQECTYNVRYNVALFSEALGAAEEIWHLMRAHMQIPDLPYLNQLAVFQAEDRPEGVAGFRVQRTSDELLVDLEGRITLALGKVLHRVEGNVVPGAIEDGAYAQLAYDHANHVQLARLNVLVHHQTVQSPLIELDLELILVDLVSRLPVYQADRHHRLQRVQAIHDEAIRLGVLEMTAQRVPALRLADQFRHQVEPHATVDTLLWDRRTVHLDLERVLRSMFPWLVHGEMRG